VAPRR